MLRFSLLTALRTAGKLCECCSLLPEALCLREPGSLAGKVVSLWTSLCCASSQPTEGTLEARRQGAEQWHKGNNGKDAAVSFQGSITQTFQPGSWPWPFSFSMTWASIVPSFPWKPQVMDIYFYAASALSSIPDGKGS